MESTLSRSKRKTHRIKPMKGPGKFRKGYFIPDNPHKYMGDVNNIIYRSSWELKAFEFCDDNKHVMCWSSEEIAIPYMKPSISQQKFIPSKYYPDLYMEYYNANQQLEKVLIEIKPKKQTRKSKARKATTKAIENATHKINEMKWMAAQQWCNANGIKFKIITENEIFR